MCLYNTLIRNRKYTSNKKNGGIIPAITDQRTLYVPIGCGNCIECRQQKARSWQIRMLEHIKEHKNGKFITLTFSNQSIAKLSTQIKNKEATGYKLDNEIATRATRLFLERWRKKYKKSLQHWFVTELGQSGTENIHLHGIIWTNETFETIAKIWNYGHIWPTKDHYTSNYVSQQTVNYIIKYISKTDQKHPYYKSIILTSPGIGKHYIKTIPAKQNQYNGTKTNELYRTSTGHRITLPIYFRNKIYSEQEREQLWLQRLNKNERWICGELVAADDTKTYNALLKWHQQRNKRLGYGSNHKDWQQENYERERRILLQMTRIKNAKTKEHHTTYTKETTTSETLSYTTPITDNKDNAILRHYLQHYNNKN